MRHQVKASLLLACSFCFLLGWLWGSHTPRQLLAEQPPLKKVETPAFPMSDRIGSNIYLQNAAEFRACCLQIYRCAEQRLDLLLQNAKPQPLKPAIVMDLDETVFDNSAFQTFLYKYKLEYTEALWGVYEEKYPQDVALIPGAKEFITRAERCGVTPVYISNRSETHRKGTIEALRLLGLDTRHMETRLLLKPKDGSSDKASRREATAVHYNVLMYFGDNLRDFSDTFAAKKMAKDATIEEYRKAIMERASLADGAACHWGVDWFVLPNPVYGEWEKLIGPDPQALFRPTSMTAPAPQ